MNRNRIIDIMKGIGILLVIIGHIRFGSVVRKLIYSFHVPLFYLISGFLFNCKNTKTIALKGFKTLILPYLFFGLLSYFIEGVFFNKMNFNNEMIAHLFWENTTALSISTGLWFLTSLFFSRIFLSIILKPSNKVRLFLLLCLSLLGLNANRLVQLPFALNTSFVGTILMYIGYEYRNNGSYYINRIKKLNIKWLIPIAVLSFFVVFINQEISMRLSHYGNYLLFFVGSLGMTYVLLRIVQYIDKTNSEESNLSKCMSLIENIGKNSITYLGMNQLMIRSIMLIFDDWGLNIFIKKGIIFVMCVFLIYVFDFFVSKTFLKILLGKRITKE